MATSSKVHLTINDTGIVKSKSQTPESAAKTSELLQENHDNHHVFYNKDGYHNHIAHHLLTLYGLGAPAEVIEQRYKENANYQRPAVQSKERVLEDMSNSENFEKYLNKEKYYRDYLVFWQNEIEKKGWENVLNEYVFAGDERGDDLLGRLYGGFLHPLIHLGFGIEFHQPAIIAEALAQICLHDNWTGNFLRAAEKDSKSRNSTNSKTIPELLDEIRANKKLSTAAEWSDGNKVRDGIIARASDEMLKYTSQWTVTPENLEQKTAEMINSCIYYTAAAQHPPKQVKIDFYYMHCVNSSIFFPTFNAQPWLSTANKVRLLQWKGYLDLAMYASRRSPPLLLSEITDYTPAKPKEADWSGIFTRLWNFLDDGHAIKLARAVRNGELVGEAWEEKARKVGKENGAVGDGMKVKGKMWGKIGNMVIDSVEDTGAHWARSVGFEEAWVEYEDRPRKSQL
ncbi:hypothetical protein L207DRAFT_514664 [Hyaloscypha variabilis F]|uniref:HypA-like protein n=1 Tax=Hyaloscypha variabilis (strain UAMH 11265 / GT02V1 / F) TaxID=1149755 RepID=A0A2J6RFU3_HYAVF|nr:hypothetical protein L207DRAFT_514664 [Hyaloscypha variabilis F]